MSHPVPTPPNPSTPTAQAALPARSAWALVALPAALPTAFPTALSAALVATLAGCAHAPAPPAEPPAPLPAAFKEADPRWTTLAPAEAQPRGAWWRVFGDPLLDRLAERAALQHTDIATARARLAQAQALLRSAQAGGGVQAALSGGLSRQGGPLLNAAGSAGTLATLGGSLSAELDLSGRLADGVEAAQRDAQSRAALLQTATLQVQAELAQTYLALRAVDAELALARRQAQGWADGLRIAQARLAAGTLAERELLRLRAEATAAEAELPPLVRQRALLEHALALLVGEPASGFSLAPLADAAAPSAAWPALPQVPPGIPSTVLARRADVAAAQQALAAAQSRRGAAEAAWFPNLLLTASGGQASPSLAGLFSVAARAWGVGALLTLPLVDGGRHQAVLAQADAEVEALRAQHRAQVLGAFREVEDQLVRLRTLADEAEAQARALALAAQAQALAERRWRQGSLARLDWLDAGRDALRLQRRQLQLRAAQAQATVGLIRALGGGWGDG